VKFREVAETFMAIEKIQSRLSITHELAGIFKKATPIEAQELCYLAMGVLNPPYVGTQFAIAQKTMTKIVMQLLSLSPEEVEKSMHALGDLGLVIQEHEWKAKQDLTVSEVYQELVAIEKISGNGSQEKKSAQLQDLLKTVDSVSAKYIVRIVLGILRLGFSDMTIVDALSWMETGDKSLRPDLEQAYNVCADIGLIAFTLKKSGIESIQHMDVHVGIPLRPAAAERLPSAQAIIEKIGPCVAEPKLDGFRLQVHIDKTGKEPLIRFFSRNLLDMSAMFPEFVHACMNLPVKSLIIDGEAIVYDPNTGTFVSFQETVKRRRKHGIEELVSELPLQLNMFDLMYLNGKNVLGAEQKERRALLRNLFEEYMKNSHEQSPKNQKEKLSLQLNVFDDMTVKGENLSPQHERRKRGEEVFDGYATQTIQVIQEVPITTAEQLEAYFIQEIAAGLEGLVIKKPDSPYQAGKRSFNWIKLKYQASEKLQDTLDVVILGYYAGKGKRAQFGIGALLVGIYNPEDDSYETIAKVGTGLTDAQWIELKNQCDERMVFQQPHNVVCSKELLPTVWVYPELVCEVLADEITQSPVHTAGKTNKRLGLALRFPRFVQCRPDKSSTQTTSLEELKTLQNRTAG
jgi:DNA ligase-1